MPTPTKGPRLGGGPAHERLILGNLAQALFEHDRITTTQAKAKRLRPLAERLVTFAKRGDLHARRRVLAVISDKGVVHRLFTEIAPDVAERQGGYTRITKIAPARVTTRRWPSSSLVREPLTGGAKTTAAARRGGASRTTTRSAAAAAEADVAAQVAEEAAATDDVETAVDAAARAEAAAEVVAQEAPGTADAAEADAAADAAADFADAAVDDAVEDGKA
ncbi:hypothetical protein GCM10025868_33140 [Angustibacter aerolatus]|uniref:50S ribosomal protein L17 n=1 Tax=Angustibacter aerolatus TaxID=1162965 RepID=A0ABQ6JJK3_9ACTN|nr:hypothetical protein GCM10025868_33140 [Angustibacter aerolatus]